MNSVATDFVPIPIQEFSNGLLIPVDMYVRLSDEKFVLVAKASTKTDVEQFRNYQNREVEYLWVKKDEFSKLTQQATAIAGIALNKKDLDNRQRSNLVSHAAKGVFRSMDAQGFTPEFYNNAKTISDAVISMVETHKVMADLFANLNNQGDWLISHAIAVSAVSVMLGNSMGFQKRSTLEKIAMGGLLHDIGLKALPKELVEKPMAAMSAEEIQAYETHSFKGMQLLTSIGIIPDDIISIVYEHHENALGQGYPQRLRDIKMHPLAKIVSMANEYVDMVIANPNTPTPRAPHEALKFMEQIQGQPYNKDVFRALKRLLEEGKKPNAA